MAAQTQVMPSGYLTNGFSKPPRLPMDTLQRAVSDLSLELKKEKIVEAKTLPPISEVEKAACECCGMSEDFTPEYIRNVKEKYCGRWICGLCAVAVDEEVGRLGGHGREEALNSHMSVCSRFNRVGRTNPALYLADGMREILKKSARARTPAASGCMGPRRSGILRSSSCIPAIAREAARAHVSH
ncbi:uncharacterized protein LOC116256506 [Nymphaea colorata]|uniref:DUF1677 domain-containing protein n=1 Tax=Nymphaea colorata TaxID=210225 RepID=A0A5K1E913_9MAGN|nr:uncharacterized protein LOC116256506 [Nymphaea colorata]